MNLSTPPCIAKCIKTNHYVKVQSFDKHIRIGSLDGRDKAVFIDQLSFDSHYQYVMNYPQLATPTFISIDGGRPIRAVASYNEGGFRHYFDSTGVMQVAKYYLAPHQRLERGRNGYCISEENDSSIFVSDTILETANGPLQLNSLFNDWSWERLSDADALGQFYLSEVAAMVPETVRRGIDEQNIESNSDIDAMVEFLGHRGADELMRKAYIQAFGCSASDISLYLCSKAYQLVRHRDYSGAIIF